MTPDLATERTYLIQERLGLLCGSATPTAQQMAIAVKEADAWVEAEELRRWEGRQKQ